METFIMMIVGFAIGESIAVIVVLEQAFKKPETGTATKQLDEYIRKTA